MQDPPHVSMSEQRQMLHITCKSSNPPDLKSAGNTKPELMSPRGSYDAYKKASQWKKYKTIEEY